MSAHEANKVGGMEVWILAAVHMDLKTWAVGKLKARLAITVSFMIGLMPVATISCVSQPDWFDPS